MDQKLAAKLAKYKPSVQTAQLVKNTPVLVLVGPTGAGKDSLKSKLLETGQFHHIVSHTTRKPRINHGELEQDGREYHFINKLTAAKMLDEGAFIEAKLYSDNLYGTSLAEIQAAHDEGKIAMTDIEVQGVAEYKALDPNVMAVFLLPPDFKTWQERLQRRYGDVVDAADHRRRLEIALQELEQLLDTNFYVPVINDDLGEAYNEIQSIITTPDHHAVHEAEARLVAEQLEKDIKQYLMQP